MSESFLNGRVTLHCGDCRDVLAGIEENSIDSCVTDPPYHLTSIVKRFGASDAKPALSANQRRWAKTAGPLFGGSAAIQKGGRMIYGVFADEKSARSD